MDLGQSRPVGNGAHSVGCSDDAVVEAGMIAIIGLLLCMVLDAGWPMWCFAWFVAGAVFGGGGKKD